MTGAPRLVTPERRDEDIADRRHANLTEQRAGAAKLQLHLRLRLLLVRRFEAARLLRTARVQLESRTMWPFYHAEGIARDVRNATVADWDERHLFNCLAWLYDGAVQPPAAAGG